LPHLPFELWNLMLGFVKHGALQVLRDDWVPVEEEDDDSDSEPESGDEDDEEEDLFCCRG
jgi:hypothetical protein